VSILGYTAGSTTVAYVVYFPRSHTTQRNALATALSSDPLAIFSFTNSSLATSYGNVTASVVLDSPPPLPPRAFTTGVDLLPPAAQAAAPPGELLSPPPLSGEGSTGGSDVATVAGVVGGGSLAFAAAAFLVWRCLRARSKRLRAGAEKAVSPAGDKGQVFLGVDGYKDSAEDWQAANKKREEAAKAGEGGLVEVLVPGEDKWKDARLKLGGTHQLEWTELELQKLVGACQRGRSGGGSIYLQVEVWLAATSKTDPRQQQDWILKCL
jgi:hypothetical protein